MAFRRFLPFPLLLILSSGAGAGQAVASETGLDPAAFAAVPAEARPLTWMHAMNGNLSAEGLARDLQALADAGVGGALLFSISRGIPRGEADFNSAAFRAAVVHGAQEARRLGLEFGLHNCDGWSSSGGPWVKVEDSMKRVVWSETAIAGGRVDLPLAMPPHAHGFYRDIGVFAVPASAAVGRLASLRPQVTLSSPDGDGGALVDPDTTQSVRVRAAPGTGQQPWIRLDYAEPFTLRSVYIEHDSRAARARLEVSDDGEIFHPVGPLRGDRTGKSRWVVEQTLDPVTARSFRIVFDNVPAGLGVEWVELLPWERIDGWPALTGMANSAQRARDGLRESTDFVPLADVRALTSHFSIAAGRLRTDLPPGSWRVLRMGYTTTGAYNHPATEVGRGWENDKFDAASLDRHFAAYVGRLVAESDAAGPHALRFAEIDSFEMGGQTWTESLPAEFAARAGYPLESFLPLLAGVPLEDAATTRALLADFTSVCTDLMEENYFRRFTELCHEHGLRSYIEPYGTGSFDELAAGGAADIPMGEFWMADQPGTTYAPAVSAARCMFAVRCDSVKAGSSAIRGSWKVVPLPWRALPGCISTAALSSITRPFPAYWRQVVAAPSMWRTRRRRSTSTIPPLPTTARRPAAAPFEVRAAKSMCSTAPLPAMLVDGLASKVTPRSLPVRSLTKTGRYFCTTAFSPTTTTLPPAATNSPTFPAPPSTTTR